MFQGSWRKWNCCIVASLMLLGFSQGLFADEKKTESVPVEKKDAKKVTCSPDSRFEKVAEKEKNNPWSGLTLEYRRYEEPRPLKCWIATIDMTKAPEVVVTCGSKDAGPEFETLSENTLEFAQREDVDFAINASAFSPFRKKAGEPMQVVGLGACEGKIYSPQRDNWGAFIQEKDGDIVISKPPYKLEDVDDAVGGFHMLIENGKDVVERCVAGVNPAFVDVNPRTAIGVDKEGKKIFVIVADGRQAKISEGITLYELAHMFQELGAYQALNLDGGGSTAMVLKDPKTGEHKLVNRSIDGGKQGNLRQVANNLGFNFQKPKKDENKKAE